MADPRDFQFDLPAARRPGRAPLAERWWPGLETGSIAPTSPRRHDPISGVRAIVIHATAGSTASGAVSEMLKGQSSFHWLVPAERDEGHGAHVWACARESRAAWHVRNAVSHPAVWGGRREINHFSLGVEIVNTVRPDDPFSLWQIAAAAAIVRYAWGKYPNLRHVVSHARLDPERRTDPGAHFPWTMLRDLVMDAD